MNLLEDLIQKNDIYSIYKLTDPIISNESYVAMVNDKLEYICRYQEKVLYLKRMGPTEDKYCISTTKNNITARLLDQFYKSIENIKKFNGSLMIHNEEDLNKLYDIENKYKYRVSIIETCRGPLKYGGVGRCFKVNYKLTIADFFQITEIIN